MKSDVSRLGVISPALTASVFAFVCSAVFATGAAAQLEVTEASIVELQDAMSAELVTSMEITAAYLARIAAYDDAGPRLNAILRLNPQALAEAEAMDRERAERGPRGPLHGVPVVVKENYDVLGLPTSGGSLALAGVMPLHDSYQVRRLREAGAVILGKTNMHELSGGMTTEGSLGGQTLNPYDLTRNPGGSSGGTAVAVSASLAAVGWGTDSCGSIRVPASQNNLVALRVTKALTNLDGILPLSRTHDVAGPVARTVRDLAIALDATVGPGPEAVATGPSDGPTVPRFVEALDPNALQGARIGILKSFFGTLPDDLPAAALVAQALLDMAALGAIPIEVAIADADERADQATVVQDEFKWDIMDYLGGIPNAPVRSLREILELGLVDQQMVSYFEVLDAPEHRVTADYLTALAARQALREAVLGVMNEYRLDAIAYPTLLRLPARVGDPQWGSNCRLSTTTGMPALTVPAGFTDQGLPIGLELLGRPFEDAHLLALAYAFEQATDHRRAPPTAPPLAEGRSSAPITFEVSATPVGWGPDRKGAIEVRAHFTLDRVMGTLSFDFAVGGVGPDQLYAVVLRSHDSEGDWFVSRALAGPGVMSGSGELMIGAAILTQLERGELYLDAFTREEPFGAARVRLTLPP